ncbi:MAG: peptide deformylase [candidate division FCPU426 bacterium]
MAILKIAKYPDPILRKKTELVDFSDKSLPKLVEDMFETMYAAEGVGLAANQVGVDLRLAVIDCSGGEDPKERLILVNPEILETRGDVSEEEGCLSFPKIRAKTDRADYAKVRAFTLKGKAFLVEGDGLLGKALQHEIDHLNGRLFIDRMGLAQKALISGKLKDLKAEGTPKKKKAGK